MGLLTFAAQGIRKIKYHYPFESQTQDPVHVQNEFLAKHIMRNKDTVFGRKHNFFAINGIDDFRKNVPICTYPDLKGYIFKGDNALVSEKILMYAITSGTTGKAKFIPVTPSFLRHYMDGWQEWIYNAYKDHPRMFRGKIFSMVSPAVEGQHNGIDYGSISGLIYENQSNIVKSFYFLPKEVLDIKDYESRYYTICRLALEENVSLMITPNPSMILLIIKKILDLKDDLILDIEHGTLKADLQIPAHIRQSIEKKLYPNKKRAAQLSALGQFYPKDYWPSLSLVGCWTDGAVGFYIRHLKKYLGNIPIRDIGYMATEGRMTVPAHDGEGSGVLCLDGNFFEFIEEERLEEVLEKKDYGSTKTAWEVKPGKDYYVLVTNQAGLYRYHINDVVRVTGFYNKTPLIKFLHKGQHVTSITGEKVSEYQVVSATSKAASKAGVLIDICIGSIETTDPCRYSFIVSFHKDYDLSRKKMFIRLLDKYLCMSNIEYKTKRDTKRLGAPVLRAISNASLERFHKDAASQRSHDSQVKIPCLSTELNFHKRFDILEEVNP